MVDSSLGSERLSEPPPVGVEHMFSIGTHEQRLNALKYLLISASVKVSSVLAVAEDKDLCPLSCNRSFSQLVSIRGSADGYADLRPRRTPLLGLALLQAVIPDQALQNLAPKDIIEFRLNTRDAYSAWAEDMDRLAARLEDVPAERLHADLKNIVNIEVKPKLREYRNEMKSVRDKLFGNLIRTVATWQLPTLSLALLSSMSFASGLSMVATALTPTIPGFVDYFTRRADLRRKNAMSYLLEVKARLTNAGGS